MKFTKQQPKDGDTVLHCGHLEAKHYHFFYFPEDDAKWMMLCDDCYASQELENCIRYRSTWMGDDPAIKVNPLRPEGFCGELN